MRLNPSPTELSTAATDVLLGALCLLLLVRLLRVPGHAWKKTLWASVFASLAAGSLLGAVAHGLDLRAAVRTSLWRPLYLSLGLSVALFFVGALGDWRGERAARTVLPWAVAAGVGFFAVTQLVDEGFGLFLVYEAAAMIAAFVIYLRLALSRVPGALSVAIGIGLTLAAAIVQASSLRARVIWSFDHNGLFHLLQIAAVIVIARGLRATMQIKPRNAWARATVSRKP